MARLEFSTRVRKRAEYEAFEFTIEHGGVRVTNASHANPRDHEYHVQVVDGLPTSCTCPADEHFEGACKHRVAVAIHRAILEPALDTSIATDGGTAPEHPPDVGCDDDTGGDCECDGLPEGVPCWPCYREDEATFDISEDSRSVDS